MSEVIGIVGAIAAAVVAYALGLRRDRLEKLREEQIRASTDFCRLLMEYSGAQLRRRTEEIRRDPTSQESEAIGLAVRSARANVWASFFHVKLVVDDEHATRLARNALDQAISIRVAGTGEPEGAYAEAKDAAEEVREKAELFVAQVALRPRGEGPEGVTANYR